MILLHPFMMSQNVWKGVAPLIADTGRYEVLAPTMPGHNGGVKGRFFLDTAERVADDVRGVPPELVHPAFHVVGQLVGVQEESAFDPAVVAGHGRCEHLVPTGLSNQWRDAFPDVLGHHERMQQKHRLA